MGTSDTTFATSELADQFAIYRSRLGASSSAASYGRMSLETLLEMTGKKYYIDSTASDQGAATGDDRTIKDFVDAIGTSKKATLILGHTGASNTTTYTLSTAESIPANITIDYQPGAILSIASGVTITFENPAQILAIDTQHIFTDANTGVDGVIFNEGGRISTGWWGASDGDDIKSAMEYIHEVAQNLTSKKGLIIVIPPGDYTFSAMTAGARKIDGVTGLHVYGYGAKVTYTGTGTHSIFLEIEDCTNILVEGLYLDGDNDTRNSPNSSQILSRFESCKYATLQNCQFIDSGWDCFYIGGNGANGQSEDISVNSCNFYQGARQCVSVTGARGVTFSNCRFENAGQSNPGSSFRNGIDLEPHDSDITNILIKSCSFINNRYMGVRIEPSTYATDSITIKNCYIAQDLDQSDSYSYYNNDPDCSIILEGCNFHGTAWTKGIDKFNDNEFLLDTALSGPNGPVRFLADASTGSTFTNNRVYMSGTAGKKMLLFSSRSGNSEPWICRVEGNLFSLDGSTSSGQDLISAIVPYTGDQIIWKNNHFQHTGSAPATPNYVALQDASFVDGGGNRFDDNIRLASTTGWNKKLYSAREIFKVQHISATTLSGGSTLLWTLTPNSVIISTEFKITTEITYDTGASWQVGFTSDPDYFGTSATETVGTTINASDWTGANPLVNTSGVGLRAYPNTGNFTAGALEGIVVYIQTNVL